MPHCCLHRYVSAASGPKEVLIMVGISDLGPNGMRAGSIKRAVLAILNGLSWADYVNVMAFGEDNHVALGETLLQATAENIANLSEVITDVVPQRESSFQSASSMFDDAYDVLNQSRSLHFTAGCNTAIIFITDDMIADGTEADDIVQQLSSNNEGIGANVFSFTVGNDTDQALAKRLACASNGVHVVVSDEDDAAEAVGSYYKYYSAARGRPDPSLAVPTWSEPYGLYTTGELTASVSVSVYDNNSDPPASLGVVSLEYSLASLLRLPKYLLNLLPAQPFIHLTIGCLFSSSTPAALTEAKEELLSRADSNRTCSSAQLGACEIEAFRESVSTGNVCFSGCSLPKSIFKPATCFGTASEYPLDFWENTNSSGLSYTVRGCCDEDAYQSGMGIKSQICERGAFGIVALLLCVYIYVRCRLSRGPKQRTTGQPLAPEASGPPPASSQPGVGSRLYCAISIFVSSAIRLVCLFAEKAKRCILRIGAPPIPECTPIFMVNQPLQTQSVPGLEIVQAQQPTFPIFQQQQQQAQSVPVLQVAHAEPVGDFTTQSLLWSQGQSPTAPRPSAPPPEVPGCTSSYADIPPA
ncbi:unnamed protein product [Chrysoparadoxa australica]